MFETLSYFYEMVSLLFKKDDFFIFSTFVFNANFHFQVHCPLPFPSPFQSVLTHSIPFPYHLHFHATPFHFIPCPGSFLAFQNEKIALFTGELNATECLVKTVRR